jgi:6-phosphogluconate dehydrogenase
MPRDGAGASEMPGGDRAVPGGSGMDIGLIGLAVMGQNLVLNMNDHGFRVAVYNRTGETTRSFLAGPAAGSEVRGFESLLQAISAKVDNEPCCEWLGEDGAGHFVKMVHNGIEYGDMQLIAEALPGPGAERNGDRDALIADLESALYASKIGSYAQGYMLMRAAREAYGRATAALSEH